MVAAARKRDLCCLYAIMAAIGAVLLISLFRGYNFSDWAMITWIAALAVVVAAVICTKCRQEEDKEQE